MGPVPEEVFTPAAPVQEDMAAARRHLDLEQRVQSAMVERGRQIVLYGDTWVGKTSLVFHVAHVRSIPMVRVECGGTFDQIMEQALAVTVV